MESFQKIKPYAAIGSVQTRKMKSTNHDAVKLVYKGNSGEPEQVLFMSSCPLYTGSNDMHN
jgi:hypothetical protein